LYLLAIANKLGHTCDFWYKIVGALSVLGRLGVIVVFTLRSSAVYGRNMWIAAYMSVVGLACIALDFTHVPGLRCSGSAAIPIAPEMLSILMIIFETSSTFFTAVRCRQALRAMKKVERQRYSVVAILLEQGLLFFCSISIFTVAGVILQYRAPQGFFQRLPNAFTLPLSCTLTARFILHLREWYATQLNVSQEHTKSGSLMFQAQSTSRSEATLTNMVTMEDFGPDPVVLAAAQGTNRMGIQLKDVLPIVRENGGDDNSAAGPLYLPTRENEAV
jgi:hypothetical protein